MAWRELADVVSGYVRYGQQISTCNDDGISIACNQVSRKNQYPQISKVRFPRTQPPTPASVATNLFINLFKPFTICSNKLTDLFKPISTEYPNHHFQQPLSNQGSQIDLAKPSKNLPLTKHFFSLPKNSPHPTCKFIPNQICLFTATSELTPNPPEALKYLILPLIPQSIPTPRATLNKKE
jgi:hypothetical protein